jgi:hypothetical protein
VTAAPFQSVDRAVSARFDVAPAVEFDESSYSARVCRCGGQMGLTVATVGVPARWCCLSCGRRQRR